mgnify:CR=1 FL=1
MSEWYKENFLSDDQVRNLIASKIERVARYLIAQRMIRTFGQ